MAAGLPRRDVAAFTAVELPAAPVAPPAATAASWVRDVAADAATNDVSGEGRLVVIMLDRRRDVRFTVR